MKKMFLLIILGTLFSGCSETGISIETDDGVMMLTPLSENAVRIQMAVNDSVPQLEELIYVTKPEKVKYSVKRKGNLTTISMPQMTVEYNALESRLTFLDKDGKILLQELYRQVLPSNVRGVPCSDITEVFDCPTGEFLYGTGQFQDGYLNIRGLTRRLTQVNTQISVPMVLSSNGYAVLWNNYGLTDFNPASNVIALSSLLGEEGFQTVDVTGTSGNRKETRHFYRFSGKLDISETGEYALLLDMGQSMSRKQYLEIDGNAVIDYANTWLPPTTSIKMKLEKGSHEILAEGVLGDEPKLYWRKIDNTTTFHSPVAAGLDYTVFAGSADECISSYRNLTGKVPSMPEWMFGYIHCRERYSSSADILENASGFRDRDIPLDVIVQDWQWWGKYGWNALRFDEDYYPDPAALSDSLHRDNVRLMLSVWSKVDRNSEAGRNFEKNGCFIDGTEWIDFFHPEAADFYCQNFIDSLGRYGIDAWWFDATEPENDDLVGRYVGKDSIPGEFYRNVYPLMVNRTMYGGLKGLSDAEPVILTRSAFSGIQRYGVVTWSGDVGNDFGSLRRQIAGGLGQMATGLPWWTFDAGGFFRPFDQYTDEAYQERMIRWLQTSVFLPFMRVHGYMSQTEPWRYSTSTESIFRKCIEQRKSLEPYILECAHRVSEENYTLMRPLVFDFPDDDEALAQDFEYMFGPDYLVCPVLEEGVTEWSVYLPEKEGRWEDIRDGRLYDGGQYIRVAADIEAIPVFRSTD